MTISPAQMRAARALLNITAVDLARRVGISDGTVSMIENGKTNGSLPTLKAIEGALMAAGVEFTPEGGVIPRQNKIHTLQGKEGFAQFRQDVLGVAFSGPTEICVSNVDEREFDKWGEGDVNDHYVSEMAQIKTFKFRILVEEGDTYFTGSEYAEYRWLPADRFGKISFYIYGDKTAIISFLDNDFNAFILSHPRVTDFYREEFDRLWKIAKKAKA